MRILIAGALMAIVCGSPMFATTAEAAPIYPWCAHYMMKGGARNCGFVSFEQCLANVSGVGGSCQQNTYYLDQPPARPRKLRHARRSYARG
jgi:hypothetical protein